MYTDYYGLSEKPFNVVPNPHFLYLSKKHQNALTYLEYGLSEDIGFILLTGDIGTGKTTLIRHLINRLDSKVEAAVIFNTNVTPGELLKLILQEFDIQATGGDKAENLDLLYRHLIKKFSAGKRILLIIDEAQNLSQEAMEEVRMLLNLQSDDQTLMQIMLVGQPELKTKLEDPSLEQLAQRIAVNYHLTALTREETGKYISHRLERAGGDTSLFTEDAVNEIFKSSKGVPRSINILCDTAIVYGFADELKKIDAPIITQVIKDKNGMGLRRSDDKVTPTMIKGGEGDCHETIRRFSIIETDIKQIKKEVTINSEKIELQNRAKLEELHTTIKKLKTMIKGERRTYALLFKRYKSLLAEKKITPKPENRAKKINIKR